MNSLLKYVNGSVWCIEPNKLATIQAFIEMRLAGGKASEPEITAAANARRTPLQQVKGATAILPMFGTLIQRAGPMEQMSGAADPTVLGQQFDQLVADESIGAIVLHIDSPGGVVYGIPELADKIYQARGKKRVIAVADGMMASAAYWAGSSADEIVASPSSDVGSIGAYLMHVDYSKALENEGVKTTIVSAGKHKIDGNPYEPLSETGLETFQESIRETYASFVSAVARNRGTTASAVRDGYGEGRVLSAAKSLEAGLIDRIATLDEVVAKLTGGNSRKVNDMRRRRLATYS